MIDRISYWMACVTLGAISLYVMLAFHVMSLFVGRQRAYHRTLWNLEHLTEWFGKTGRHRRGDKGQAVQQDAKKAEG